MKGTAAATDLDACATLASLIGEVPKLESGGRLRVEVPRERLAAACTRVHRQMAAPLATMIGLDDRERAGGFRLVYVFSLDDKWLSIETLLDPSRPVFPSVTPHVAAAHWYEREVRDLLGMVPEGHPDPRPLVLHDDWPRGTYPLRKDFDPLIPVPRQQAETYRFHHLHGEGIVEIPVGPIHAGVIEPGHFRFAAVGEVILHLEARLFYSHRGIEKLCEGKSAAHVLQVAERICGACSVSHAVAFCQATEQLAGVIVPDRAAALRSVFMELERLYNHIGDLGNICAGVGFAVGTSMGGRLKEEIQQLNERLTGHRFLRGVCAIGGVRRDVGVGVARDAIKTLDNVKASFQGFVGLILSTDPFIDRLRGTGVVPTAAAWDLGAVGVAARASGLDRDARRDHPHAAYTQHDFAVRARDEGDVYARAMIRVDETLASFALLGRILSDLPAGPLSARVAALPEHTTGIGVTESPRGENIHWVRTGANGLIDRYRIRSASFCNWPIVALAVPGNMVPDFPLINKSFELCYSCLDR